jgi:hypothetical protein
MREPCIPDDDDVHISDKGDGDARDNTARLGQYNATIYHHHHNYTSSSS